MQNLITLVFLLGLILTSGANAASYQMNEGTIVDPIANKYGGDLTYVGANLEPNAVLTGAWLENADLFNADLSGADLSGAHLWAADLDYADLSDTNLTGAELGASLRYADLTNAVLSGADLEGANLFNADLSDTNLTGADLQSAYYLGTTTGSAYYNAETYFNDARSGDWRSSALFDPVAAGWTSCTNPRICKRMGTWFAQF